LKYEIILLGLVTGVLGCINGFFSCWFSLSQTNAVGVDCGIYPKGLFEEAMFSPISYLIQMQGYVLLNSI
jgi:hypothetical protein